MRYRLMATYCGAPYQAGLGPDGTEVTLFAACPPPEELGFSSASGHWRKQVDISDLDALWQSRPVGDYRGDPCLVLDDLGDRLHIVYLGRDAVLARQLGYWEVDREVFEVVVPRHEVTDLTEERDEIPLAAATFPPSDPEPRGAEAQAAGERGEEKRGGEPRVADRQAPVPDRAAAWHGSPEPGPWTGTEPGGWSREPRNPPEPWGGPDEPRGPVPQGRRNGREVRASTQSVFADLLDLASIPQTAYALDEEVPGAICLLKTDGGFEVFSRTDDARLEERFFEDEEAAYFYLFGVLAAEAVRSGRLGSLAAKGFKGVGRPNGYRNGSRIPGTPSTFRGNVSKYLRSGKLPKMLSRPARVYLAGGADGPPLPKQPRRPPKVRVSRIALRITNRYPHHSLPCVISVTHAQYGGVMTGFAEPSIRAMPVAAGVASLAARDLLLGARRHGKVLAVLPHGIYLEFGDTFPEPRVIVISPPGTIRLPNAIVAGPLEPGSPAECLAGDGRVMACGLDIRIVRWWDPSPVFGPLSRVRLDHGSGILSKLCEQPPGLAGHDGPAQLAACCAGGDLAGAVEAAERLVGLGPGLMPSGDSVVSGVLLALRLLGGAISGGTRAVWLANWLSASVTCYATQRTTTLAASLLHCAANGQAAAEVSAVLLGMAGQEPLEPAAAKLLAADQGADLAWGLVAGCRAALLLSVS